MKNEFSFCCLCSCYFLLGLGLVAYPIVSSYYTEKHQSQVHTQYQEVFERADSREMNGQDSGERL